MKLKTFIFLFVIFTVAGGMYFILRNGETKADSAVLPFALLPEPQTARAVDPSGYWDMVYVVGEHGFVAEEVNPPSVFRAYSFWLYENQEAYYDFLAQNPGKRTDEVVWMVNASLHLPFYTNIQTNYAENPLLVNPFNRLPDGFVPASLEPVVAGSYGLMATEETMRAFRTMNESARQDGIRLVIGSAYRTAERQRVLYNNSTNPMAVARPHHSEHQTGRALDLINPTTGQLVQAEDPVSLWVLENAHRYGFIVRYLAETIHITGFIHEPWHITYVGVEVSRYMRENNILSLEEFVGRNPGIVSLYQFRM